MSSLILSTFAATAMAAINPPPIPENIDNVPEAIYTEKLVATPLAQQYVERKAARAQCTGRQVNQIWTGLKIVVLLLVDDQGNIQETKTVDANCRPVEDYGTKRIIKHNKYLVNRANKGQLKWVRSSIGFIW